MQKSNRILAYVLVCAILAIAISTGNSIAKSYSASEILEKSAEKYMQLSSFSCSVKTDITIVSDNIPNRLSYISEINIVFPNKFKILNTEGFYGKSIISNAYGMWTYMPTLKRYSFHSSPSDAVKFLHADPDDFESMGIKRFLLFNILNRKHKKSENRMKGNEIIDGVNCYKISSKKPEAEYFLWISKDSYLFKKIRMKMKSDYPVYGIHPEGKIGLNINYTETYYDITKNPSYEDEYFSFEPPEDAVRASDVYGPGEHKEYLNLGKKYKDFQFVNYKTGKKEVFSEKNERASVLFFMDCFSEEDIELAGYLDNQYRKNRVSLLGIFKDEKKRNKEELLEELNKNISFPVTYDKENKIFELYSVENTPVVIMISEKGIIEQIYSGYFEGVGTKIEEDIKYIARMKKSEISEGRLAPQWRLDIKASGVNVSDKKMIAAVNPAGEIYLISNTGRIINIIRTDDNIRNIIFDDEVFLGYNHQGRNLTAYKVGGEIKWRYSVPLGINSISKTDRGNTLLSTNGSRSLIKINNKKNELFVSSSIENALSSDSGDDYIIAVNGTNKLFFVDYDGNLIDTKKTSVNAEYVKILNDEYIMISGSEAGEEIIGVVDRKGNSVWESILGPAGSSKISSCSIHPAKEWFALGTLNGNVQIYDIYGNIITSKNLQGVNVFVEWHQVDEGIYNLLAGSVDDGLKSYAVE